MRVADVFRRGIAAGGTIVFLGLTVPAMAQSLPTRVATTVSLVGSGLPDAPAVSGKPPGGLLAREERDARQTRSPYFDRWGIELSGGSEALEGLPGAISTEGFFLSAGFYLGGSLAVIAETGTTGWATGRLTTPGRAPERFVDAPRSWPSKPAACPEIDAGFGTYLGGVQYRGRFRRTAVLVRGLAGRAEYSGTATEVGGSGVHTSCYEAFGTGRALVAGGGIDVHLNDRIAIRVLADFRRLAVPSLEGMESVFMAPGDGARLDMVRVAVGLVLGI